MDRAGRAFDLQVILVSLAGVGLTVLFVPPGRYSVGVGPVGVDPFYAILAWFVGLGVWSGLGLWARSGRAGGDDDDGDR